jgi:hypothetical protein
MKLAGCAATLGIVCATGTAVAGAATMKEVDGWIAATKNIVRVPSEDCCPGSPVQHFVRVTGTKISGWIDPTYVDHGFLQNKQEVMLVPVLYGHGVTATLVFTRLGGYTRFVRAISSRDGLVEVLFTDGAILLRTSIYKPKDEEGYPSGFHYERDTLRGMTLVKLSEYDTKK